LAGSSPVDWMADFVQSEPCLLPGKKDGG
jgi:hypothetical protein